MERATRLRGDGELAVSGRLEFDRQARTTLRGGHPDDHAAALGAEVTGQKGAALRAGRSLTANQKIELDRIS